MSKQKELTVKQQLRALYEVALMSFRIAPGAVLFKLVGSIINALLPIATTYYAAKTLTVLADAYAGKPHAASSVSLYVAITALLGLIMTVWSSLDQFVQSKMRYVVETRIGTRMYEHFLALDFWRYDDKETADRYDRAQKFAQFYGWVFDRLANLISQLIAVVSAVIALGFVNKTMAFLVCLAIVPGVFVQFVLTRRNVKHWNEHVETRRALGLIEWDLTQPRLISELRLYGMVKYMLELRTKLRDEEELGRLKIEKGLMPLTLAANVLTAAVELGALLWVVAQIAAKNQPIGQFAYVQQLVSRVLNSASSLVSTIGSIDEDVANLFDYQLFMKLPAGRKGNIELSEAPQKISFDTVSFRYPGQKHDVLKNISFEITRGKHIAIVGENGAGKSTLIKLLTGLYEPTKGSVLLDTHNLHDVATDSWHAQLGVLQQEFLKYGFATAADNVRFGNIQAAHSPERLDQALADAEATSFVTELPQGKDGYVNVWMEDDDGNKGTELSGGQWQRLALARDFYRQAPIIILDEPTSAIDAAAEARIFDKLFSKKDRTIVAISHRLSTIRKADVIYMLKDGRIVETGTYTELLRAKGPFYTMFQSQLE